MSRTDYNEMYEGYWAREDRIGEHSFQDAQELARKILSVCGPGKLLDTGCGMGLLVRTMMREGVDAYGMDIAENAVSYCNERAPGRYQQGSLLEIPHPDASFQTVVSTDVLEHLAEEDVPRALAELHRVSARYAFIVLSTEPDRDGEWHLTIQKREWWDRAFFAAGFRRHPLLQSVVPYESIEQDGAQITLLFEKLPPGALEQHTEEELRAHEMLHMDMLRSTGRRADAHLARYELARRFIRPGDAVLDLACGLGYGSAILAAGSSAQSVLGVDNSERAITYANDCYAAGRGDLCYQVGDAASLAFLPDQSIDFVTTFETLEHIPDPVGFLAELARVLRPGGRVISSVPNDWSDETGEDPNPHHLHVYHWPQLLEQMSAGLRPEKAWAQIAGGAQKLAEGQRVLHEVPLDREPECKAEWWLMLSMREPLGAEREGYRETTFPDHTGRPGYRVADFGADYENPWLVKALITRGMCIERGSERVALAESVRHAATPGSADAGSALCVLAYSLLEQPDGDPAAARRLLQDLQRFDEQAAKTPHALRWRISNRFAAALLLLAAGDRQPARREFLRCAELDFAEFSPLLATKTVDALCRAGRLSAADGDLVAARECFERAIREAQRAVSGDWLNVIGDPAHPLSFGLPEASQVLDLAASAAYSLLTLEHQDVRPGWSWIQARLSPGEAHAECGRQLAALRASMPAITVQDPQDVGALSEALAASQQRAAELQSRLDHSEAALAELKRSRAWKLAGSLAKVRQALGGKRTDS